MHLVTPLHLLAIDFSTPELIESLNSEDNDFAPVWNKYEQLLYFNSDRDGYSDFYTSEYVDGEFVKIKLRKDRINQSKNNQSFISFVSKNEAILSTYQIYSERSYINIFKSVKEQGRWTKPFPLTEFQCHGFRGQTTISPEGDFMVFASNCRLSGYFDTDLWFSYRENDGKWSSPILIEELSTPGNEITPFLLSNDTLLFASDAMGGPGGFDLYMSIKINGKWHTPRILKNINTEFNESDPTIINHKKLIFASDRPMSQGAYDLFVSDIIHKNEGEVNNSEIELSIRVQTLFLSLQESEDYIIAALFPYKLEDKNYNLAWIYDSLAFQSGDIIDNRALQKTGGTGRNKHLNTGEIFPQFFHDDVELISASKLIVNKNILIKPKKLNIKLNSAPKEIIKNWVCKLKYNGTEDEVLTDLDLPCDELVDLSKLSNISGLYDSLYINFDVYDNNNNIHSQKLKLTVSKSNSTGMKLFTHKQKKHYMFLLPVVDRKIYNTGFINDIIDNIIMLNNNAKVVKINYFNTKSRKSAQYIKSILKSKLRKEISVKKVQYSANNLFSKEISPYIIQIIVEI